MDAARQTLRWSVPGSVFILLAYCIQLGLHLASSDIDSFPGVKNAGMAVLTILAGIPIGFLLYQVYYSSYSPTGWSILHGLFRKPHFVRFNRGADILQRYFNQGGSEAFLKFVSESDAVARASSRRGAPEKQPYAKVFRPLPLNGFRSLRIADGSLISCTFQNCRCSASCFCRTHVGIPPDDFTGCRCARDQYARYFRQDWGLVQCCLDVTDTFKTGAGIKSEYTTGSDLYHAMGSVRLAVSMAVFGTAAYNFAYHRDDLIRTPCSAAIFAGILVFVYAALWLRLTKARRRTLRNFDARTSAALAWFSRNGKWDRVPPDNGSE